MRRLEHDALGGNWFHRIPTTPQGSCWGRRERPGWTGRDGGGRSHQGDKQFAPRRPVRHTGPGSHCGGRGGSRCPGESAGVPPGRRRPRRQAQSAESLRPSLSCRPLKGPCPPRPGPPLTLASRSQHAPSPAETAEDDLSNAALSAASALQAKAEHFQNWSPRAWTTSHVSGSAPGSGSAVLTGRCAQREPTTAVKPNATETWRSTRFKSPRGARGPGLSPRSSRQGSPLFLSSAIPDPLTPAQAQLTPFLAPQSSPPGAARKLSGNSVCPAVAVTA